MVAVASSFKTAITYVRYLLPSTTSTKNGTLCAGKVLAVILTKARIEGSGDRGPLATLLSGHVFPFLWNSGRYFSIAVADNATDLLISLDPQSGDPDM